VRAGHLTSRADSDRYPRKNIENARSVPLLADYLIARSNSNDLPPAAEKLPITKLKILRSLRLPQTKKPPAMMAKSFRRASGLVSLRPICNDR
jgi:hypothetical protein